MSIERKSVREGFRIRQIDEEARINITLLQKLKSDFGIEIAGLDPLPEDESGLDLPKILHQIRKTIKRQPRWKVVEQACLSILTFSRFLMWLDLEANADTLKANPIVRHLVENYHDQFEPEASFPNINTLDDQYPPSETYCPLPADSTQLRAVFAAMEGRTFVLQGPPGTGKSQTIANLIAQSLTIGKRVLFVAQKRAALDVVHDRLTKIGLGPFCLELHSNKATKESFRTQIRSVLNLSSTMSCQDWSRETDRLAALRRELNAYAQDLHHPREFGKNAYWIISRLIGHEGQRKVALDLGEPSGRKSADYEKMQAAVRELSEAARLSGDPCLHPLKAIRIADWTYGLEDDAKKAINNVEKALARLRRQATNLLPNLGLIVDDASRSDLNTASELTLLLQQTPEVSDAILREPDWPHTRGELKKWIALGRDCEAKRFALKKTYTDGLFSLDLSLLLEKLNTCKSTWFYRRWRLAAAVKKTIRNVRKASMISETH